MATLMALLWPVLLYAYHVFVALQETGPIIPPSHGDQSALLTPERIFWIVALIISGVGHFFQFRNSRSGVIHETDMKQINSLDGALKRAEIDREVERVEKERLVGELVGVKRELVALMSIDIHELLGFAALKRERDALDTECARLAKELARKGGEV